MQIERKLCEQLRSAGFLRASHVEVHSSIVIQDREEITL